MVGAASAQLEPVGCKISSRATAAVIAPTASIQAPSASSTVATVFLTRSCRTSGVTTVGPVTMSSVPKSSERSQPHPWRSRRGWHRRSCSLPRRP